MLTDVYKPVINGITNFCSLCKKEMEAIGHEVTIFTFSHQDQPDKEPGIVRSPAIPLSDTGYHFSLLYSREARDLIQTMDILHTHHPFVSGRMATRYGRQFNLPIVFTNHTRYDLYAQAYLPLVPPVFTNMLIESFLPSFTTLCDLVIAPSASIKQVLLELGVKKEIHIVPNGIDIARYRKNTALLNRQDLGIPDESIVIAYCGRLAIEKNLDMLLQAFHGASLAAPNAHLLIIGGGPAESHLREQAEHMQRVHFAGHIDYDNVPAYLALADIFATTSVTEVHPLSVIEALATGLPVVAIKSPGIIDTVRPDLDGYLVENDPAEFAAMLVKMLLEPERRSRMALSAHERSVQFDIKTTVATLVDHYERLIADIKTYPPKEKAWQKFAREVNQVLGE
ncbi:MAG: glycosyltransferase [Anaerolineales bacterium]|nr:glycosyltransferase [Anaerolineales bacterium]